jgi:nitrous oxidase accessory protein NosD
MSKRIRCSCGRVYDPGKHAACPVCGATNVVVAEPPPLPPNESEKPAVERIAAPALSSSPRKTSPGISLSPRHLAIGGAVVFLLLIVVALSRHGGKEKSAVVVAPTPTATVATTPTPIIATPAPTVVRSTPTAAPITPSPTRPAVVLPPPPGLTNGLAEQIANAASGATIQVPPGVYPGGLVATRAIHLVGANEGVFIQSQGQECLAVRAPGVTVQNIRFSREGAGNAPALSVGEGADLQMQNCQVQANRADAVLVASHATIKAQECAFSSRQAAAIRLTKSAEGEFRQASFSDSNIGLCLEQGAQGELHSCAFERDGGAIMVLNNAPTKLTADDCKFENNPGGIDLAGATLGLTNCSFSQNGVEPRGAETPPLFALHNKANLTLNNLLFEANQEGIALYDGSRLEAEKCQFTRNGPRQLRAVIPTCEPLSISGEGSTARIRTSAFAESAQYAVLIMAGGKIELEEVEISGTQTAGLVVGDRAAGAATARIKSCRFRNNGTGLGVFAGSSATLQEAQFWDNQDGIIVLDERSQVSGTKLDFARNRDVALFVHALGRATVKEAQFQDNKRDAVAGVKGQEAQRGTLALENCRFRGSGAFAIGACRGSDVSLTNCNFVGTKKEVYRESGAKVQRSEETPTASPTPSVAQTSPTPEAGNSPNESPSPTITATPTPRPKHRPHRHPTPRPHPPTPDEIRRALRRLLPGG